MSSPVVNALKREIGNINDNIARAEHQRAANPHWISGNGETIDEVLSAYRDQRRILVEDARDLGIDLS